MNTEKIEVLAPAGNPEALRAAVFAGADAVYMGGALFSARAAAVNFTREEMAQAVRFAHARNVRVYVTVNTLMHDVEAAQALDFCAFLCEIAVDGILIQDMGLFGLLRAACPEMPLHASTQMSLHTAGGAAFLQEIGAARVVLAREMSLDEIRAVQEKTDVELEAFVHGALCMSVSGQCYFSAMLGSRSGNRGRCAQTCRLPFAAAGGTGHDLSLKDMSFIAHIDALRAAGVCSAKIEGRQKRPEYVAAAVSACRHAADGEAVPADLLESLNAVFSRSGFTDGYLTAHRGRGMFGIRTKEDVAGASGAVFGALHGLYKNENPRVPVTLSLRVVQGENPVLAASDGSHAVSVRADAPAEAAARLPVDTARWEQQLKKTGGTPFFCAEVQVETDGETAVPIAGINALRRTALDRLLEQRAEKSPVPFHMPAMDFQPHQSEKTALRGWFMSAAQIPKNASLLENLVLPADTALETLAALRDDGHELILELPRALFGVEEAVAARIAALKKEGFTAFRCGNLGAVALCRAEKVAVHGGFSLNAMNTACLAEFEALGFRDTELSIELTGAEMAALGGNLRRGLVAYGRLPLMLTRNCPLMNAPGGCKNCATPGVLRDRMGVDFPVMCTRFNGRPVFSEVLNSVPTSLADRFSDCGADFGVLRFTVESAVESAAVLEAFVRRKNPQGDCTKGLFTRGVL